mmetsp:Transcript_24286/g.74885  ORF Transcript_24286/g.74885 Transcript_24286/m.74885 type:complete len:209 (+) Transcript_24286:819-1445(+)
MPQRVRGRDSSRRFGREHFCQQVVAVRGQRDLRLGFQPSSNRRWVANGLPRVFFRGDLHAAERRHHFPSAQAFDELFARAAEEEHAPQRPDVRRRAVAASRARPAQRLRRRVREQSRLELVRRRHVSDLLREAEVDELERRARARLVGIRVVAKIVRLQIRVDEAVLVAARDRAQHLSQRLGGVRGDEAASLLDAAQQRAAREEFLHQ